MMNITRRSTFVLAAVLGSFLAGSLSAAPGPSGGSAGGPGSTGGGNGGGHGSGGNGGGITSAPASVGHASAGPGIGSRAASVSAPTSARSGSTVSSGAPRNLVGAGGIATNGSGQFTSQAHPAGSRSVNRPVTASQQSIPTVSQSVPTARIRPANAWTDDVNAINRQANRAAIANRDNRSAAAYRQYLTSGNYHGQINPEVVAGSYLYPGVYGSTLNRFYNGQSPRGLLSGERRVRSFTQENRWDGPNGGRNRYRPNGYYPAFGVYGYPFFGSYGDYGDSFSGAYDGGSTVNTNPVPYAPEQPVATVQDDAQNPAPDVPAPDTGNRANPPTGTLGNGPDSLVEAVQAELARRGYFTGKIDAIYGAATKDALSRFQQDQKLNATGRVNEATLHALQLD